MTFQWGLPLIYKIKIRNQFLLADLYKKSLKRNVECSVYVR